ncbi:MAG: glycosyltransferase family 2 protein [Leptolyngbyaceae cyanobacterium bins.302]|nr:glycosyltransferase family 2 protein [Leptolyngbyaceae cyanobacterium bins.302]
MPRRRSAVCTALTRIHDKRVIYLITVNYDSAELIKTLLASIQPSFEIAHRFVIVNNSPSDRQIHTLATDSVRILEAGNNLGFGGGCNLGLQWVFEQDRRAIVWLINPDTTLQPDSLLKAGNFCRAHPELSIMGTIVREPDGKIWFAGGEFQPENGRIVAIETLPKFDGDYIETAWVTGCSLLLNLQNFAVCPQFDPDYFLYYEDFDFCHRYAKQGHSIVITNHIQITHQPSSITGRNLALKVQLSTTSYLLALERHTYPTVLLYRLSRILFHALRVSLVEPEKAIAIIKGVLQYLKRVRGLGKFNHG